MQTCNLEILHNDVPIARLRVILTVHALVVERDNRLQLFRHLLPLLLLLLLGRDWDRLYHRLLRADQTNTLLVLLLLHFNHDREREDLIYLQTPTLEFLELLYIPLEVVVHVLQAVLHLRC